MGEIFLDGREEGARHMVKKLGKLAVDAGPLFTQALDGQGA